MADQRSEVMRRVGGQGFNPKSRKSKDNPLAGWDDKPGAMSKKLRKSSGSKSNGASIGGGTAASAG